MLDLRAALEGLCSVTPDRRPGSAGNQRAVEFVAATLAGLGWTVETPSFDVVDWEGSTGSLSLGEASWPLHPSPYSTGWTGLASVQPVATEDELLAPLHAPVLLLHGDLTAGPLTPKGYPFYGSDRDTRIIERLETAGLSAVLAVTGLAPELAGSWDPFPLIEDGAFAVPTGNLRADDGAAVLAVLAADPAVPARIDLPARRWPATACNVLARRGGQRDRVTVVAHLDSKPGTPGAVDNATGVVVLLRIAELLADSEAALELLAVNGEDYYAASGERHYLHQTDLGEVRLAVNIDGVGYRGGPTAWSGYGLPEDLDTSPLRERGLIAGPPWPQSDHMVFAMAGRPAIVLTSSDFATVMGSVAHSADDTPDLVDIDLLEQAAQAVAALIRSNAG